MIQVRKVVYQVHMDRLDDDGNVTAELSTQEPLTLYAHQLAELPEQVTGIIAQAEQRTDIPTASSPAKA